MNNGSELTCYSCKHWHAKERTAQTLGQPQRGDCRFGPPHVTTLPGPGGNVGTFSTYPDLPAQFPACGQHQPKLTEIAR